MMKMEAMIWRACGWVPDKQRVMMARTTKFVPPAKSVSLSNLKVKAMEKKKSW